MKKPWLNFLCILKFLLHRIIEKDPKLSYFEGVLKQNMDSGAIRQSFLGNIED